MPLYNEEKYAKLYKQTGKKEYKDKSVEEMKDMVYSTVMKFNRAKSIDMKALYHKGLGIAYKAIDSWDPDRGVKLTTHVVNQMKPLWRTVYKSNIMHIPEHRIKDWGILQSALLDYELEHGTVHYDPVILASMSNLPVKRVEDFLKENRKVYNTSDSATTNISWPKQDYKLSLDLLSMEFKEEPVTKKIWELVKKDLEKGKKPSANEMSVKLKLPYNEVNKIFKEMLEKVQQVVLGGRSQ